METGPWNECVPVRMADDAKIHMVSNTRQAAELLANRWPIHRGRAYENAIGVCQTVLEGDCPSYVARAAFVAAAKEANVLVVH